MLGFLLAGLEESPGELVIYEGRRFKQCSTCVVGMIVISWPWWDVTLTGVELAIGLVAALPAALLAVTLRPGVTKLIERWFFTTDSETERYA